MVRLTPELIARGSSGYSKRKKDESLEHFINRLTHLYLEQKSLTEVGEDLSQCSNLTVLYLYDNQLTQVPNLISNTNLTHLYLQNNAISKIANLSSLANLTKLYLGGNHITVVEGLNKLHQLQELHIENQLLPSGEQLLFDPRSLHALSSSLEILNISGNNVESLKDLECLYSLTTLYAGDNLLVDIKELSQLCAAWFKLWRLELQGNPLCQKAKYRDRIIVACKNLKMLDGKEVAETTRQFLQSWHATRESNKKRQAHLARHGSFITEAPPSKSGTFPPVQAPLSAPPGKSKNAFQSYMMPGLPRKEFEDLLARKSASGDSRPTSKTVNGLFRAKSYRSFNFMMPAPK